jgi:hypothetical protein
MTQKRRLGGWQRLGIVISTVWTLSILGLVYFEKKEGPFSHSIVTDTVVAKTGEPASVLNGNSFKDLVPVETVLNYERFLALLFGPMAIIWLSGYCYGWIREGFKPSDH